MLSHSSGFFRNIAWTLIESPSFGRLGRFKVKNAFGFRSAVIVRFIFLKSFHYQVVYTPTTRD